MMGAESQFVVDMCGNDDAGTAFIASNAVVTAADSVASLAQNGATPAAGKYGNGDIVADTVPSLAIMQDATTTTGADDDEDVVSRAANVAVKPEKG